MSKLGTFAIQNMPLARNIWKEIGSSFDNVAQALDEFVDDSLSNLRCHKDDPTLARTIRITVRNQKDSVDVTVEDGGTGIKNMNNALTLAGLDAQESPLNEHGYGLKHALAYIEGNGSDWEICTRDEQDRLQDRYRSVKPPYAFGDGAMQGSYESGWVGTLGATGTVIRFRCSMDVFGTLVPDRTRETSFEELMDILEEHLSFTYANILESGEIRIELVEHTGDQSKTRQVQALVPHWKDGTVVEVPPQTLDLGGGALEIRCRYGEILPGRERGYYSGNMATSGVEIRINGRMVDRGMMKEIWGKMNHNKYNAFLVQVNLETDQASAIPSTKTAKNGFRLEKPMLRRLFQWIRKTVELPAGSKLTREQVLIRKLADRKNESGMTRVSPEEGVFRSLDLDVRVDLFTCQGDYVCIYEGKVGKSRSIHVYQLRMYWDGCVQDGIPVNEAVLVAGTHTPEVERMVEYINGLKGPDGKPYRFRLTTWAEEGISCENL